MYNSLQKIFIIGFIFLNDYVSLVNCHEIDEVVSNLLIDVTNAIFLPSAAISALLCANSGSKLLFSRILSKNNILHNFLSFGNIEENKFPLHKTVILTDLNCPRILNFLQMANETGMFSGPLRWIFLQDLRNIRRTCSDDCLLDDFKDYAMYPDSEVIVLRRLDENNFRILSIYRPSPTRDMTVEKRGLWSYNSGLALLDHHVASRRRRNLQKTNLKSSIVVTNPDTMNHLTDYQDKHIDTVTKCNYIWLHHIVAVLNATVTVDYDDTWGYPDSNGTWTGMMARLINKEADIGGTPMFITAVRLDHVAFTPLTTSSGVKFIFRQPPLSSVSNLFTLPFRRSVWIVIGLLLMLILLFLVIVTKWEWKKRNLNKIEDPMPTISDHVLLIIGTCATQGSLYYPETISSRSVLMTLLLTSLVLYSFYSANIVALLQSTSSSIKSLKDLLDSPMACGAHDIVYNYFYLKEEKEPLRRAIIDKKIQPKNKKSNMLTPEEGIARVRKGFFAFNIELGPGYKIIQETFEEDEKCGLMDMSFISQSDPTLALAKNSPYMEIIRVAALKIEETGLKSREMSRFYTKRPTCNGRNKFVSVGISECYFLIFIQGYGLLISLAILTIEILWSKITSQWHLRPTKNKIPNKNLNKNIFYKK